MGRVSARHYLRYGIARRTRKAIAVNTTRTQQEIDADELGLERLRVFGPSPDLSQIFT